MNENINLVEILKDCPTGTEFYSPLFGKVTFDCITCSTTHPIKVISSSGVPADFDSSGKYYGYYLNSECLLFPSKDQRDWDVWYNNHLKEKTKEAFQSFNDGDYIHFNTNSNKWTVIYRKNNDLEVRGYVCHSDYYLSVMEDKGYVGTKPYAHNVRLATPQEIAELDSALAKVKKKWNPITKKVEDIKIEMTISEIENKLGLTSGSLRIKK